MVRNIDQRLVALWVFARPNLDPMDYSLGVLGKNGSFAADFQGSFANFAPDAPPEGLVDGVYYICRELEFED
ncbi:hypothetical protein M3J09_005519 [Ascochyta lentis]